MAITDIPFSCIVAQDGCADVVFVHGLTGSPLETWTSENSSEPEGKYWPKWLGADLPHLNLYAVGYPASLFSKWANKEMDLYERAKSLLEIMASYDVGERPIVFVGHSLGGLLIKQMLRTARESSEPTWKKIADSCSGVMFLATPHSGSSLADLLAMVGFTSPHIEKLKKDSSDLNELNESFRSFCTQQPFAVTAFYEMFKTKKFAIVVDRSSADPGVGGSLPIAVDADHISICRPENRHAPIYRSIYSRLKRIFPPPPVATPSHFEDGDDLSAAHHSDRRDLQTKMIAADREHEYTVANERQNSFARLFMRTGLLSSSAKLYNAILQDIEQRFENLVYHPLICKDAPDSEVSVAVQTHVIDPVAKKYADQSATPATIMNALYFLTERCHVRWDKP
ncbi:alpha/beta hydrolase [Rhizobium leguminosarum]|uniref:Alpha/beta hydrolase n=1 Tax=Rhizobium ruizarguesonis TaxID=2081791 RepID=A0AAE4YSV0_9HYPH|nr:ABC-three component system protein [Rhizobium ruizarguesonis]NEI50526.1 alpha/beta hydrolase [Rhizobium ruizarguesonis]